MEGLKKGAYYIALVLPSLTPTGALDNAISVYQSLTSSFSQHSPSTLSALSQHSLSTLSALSQALSQAHSLSDRQRQKYLVFFSMMLPHLCPSEVAMVPAMAPPAAPA